MKDIIDLFIQTLELENEKESVTLDSKLSSFWQWDSVGKLSFVAKFNDTFKKTITLEQLNGFVFVKDIVLFFNKN